MCPLCKGAVPLLEISVKLLSWEGIGNCKKTLGSPVFQMSDVISCSANSADQEL